MKKFLISIIIVLVTFVSFGSSTHAEAKVRVKVYTTKSGKYVAPHYRTDANHIKADNWSTKGNYNPYTGKKGSKKLY